MSCISKLIGLTTAIPITALPFLYKPIWWVIISRLLIEFSFSNNLASVITTLNVLLWSIFLLNQIKWTTQQQQHSRSLLWLCRSTAEFNYLEIIDKAYLIRLDTVYCGTDDVLGWTVPNPLASYQPRSCHLKHLGLNITSYIQNRGSKWQTKNTYTVGEIICFTYDWSNHSQLCSNGNW